jgi:hypothetical protein
MREARIEGYASRSNEPCLAVSPQLSFRAKGEKSFVERLMRIATRSQTNTREMRCFAANPFSGFLMATAMY